LIGERYFNGLEQIHSDVPKKIYVREEYKFFSERVGIDGTARD